MKKSTLLLVFAMLVGAYSATAQFGSDSSLLYVDSAFTHQVLVGDTLISGCVTAHNITYTGDNRALGYFNNNSSNFPFESGIILTSGEAINAIGPNNSGSKGTGVGTSGDVDLNILSGVTTYDAAILEFDFVPASDTLSFRYVFASEEYNEYTCASVNDAFGFFISGPGIAGPYTGGSINIALIPNTTIPVSINTVNNGSIGSNGSVSNCPDPIINLGNSAYFYDNAGSPSVQYDGFTMPLTATAIVTACETYHIKLKIADGGDSAFDSGVFIETGSFSDGTAVTINNVNPTGTQNDLYEGCVSYYVFMRQDTTDTTDPVNIPLGFSGTATNGVDLTQFPSNILIPAGEIADTIQYTVFNDGLLEPTEIFIIEILAGCPCNQTPARDTITLYDFREFKASIINTDSMFCGTAAPPTYTITSTCVTHPDWFTDFEWNTGSHDTFITVTPPIPGNHDVYWVEVTDICGNGIRDSLTIGVSNLAGLNVISEDALCHGGCNGTAVSTPVTIGSTPGTFYRWSDMTNTTPTGNRNDLCWGNYTVTVTDNSYCEFDDNFMINQPSAALSTSSGIVPFDTTFCESPGQIQLEAFANISDVNFTWNGGVATNNQQDVSPNIGINTYYVDITDYCGFNVSDTIRVYVSDVLTSSSVVAENTSCFQVCDGTIEVLTPYGIPPYYYQWGSNNLGTFTTYVNTLDSVCPDTFTLAVIDFAGCIYEDDIIIEEPPLFDPAASMIISTDTMWCGVAPPASIQLEASSNLEANYLWSTGETSSYISVVPVQGTTQYSVEISDNCGNSKTDYINVVVSTLSGISSSVQATTCFNSCDGVVEITPTGGITPFEYIWSPGNIGTVGSNTINTLCGGNYSVLVRDAGGCEFTENFEIESPPNLNGSHITNTDSLFCGGVTVPSSITIETDVNNAVTYNWSTGESTPTISFAPQDGANTFWVDFTDVCGNVHRDSMTFSVSNFVGANILMAPANCFGGCDGTVQLSPLFGMAPFSYAWSVPGVGTTPDGALQNICAGVYQVTVSDAAECFVVKDFTILQPDSLTFDFATHNSFGTACDGFATVTNTDGGTPPFTYLWDDPNAQTTYNASGLCAGLYTVLITDSKGCEYSDTIRILDLTGISESVLSDMINVYPNPSNGNIVVELNDLASSAASFKVFDITGKQIYSEKSTRISDGKLEINNLPSGINMLQIELSNNTLLQKKLIIIK